jgi:hypothetical protein
VWRKLSCLHHLKDRVKEWSALSSEGESGPEGKEKCEGILLRESALVKTLLRRACAPVRNYSKRGRTSVRKKEAEERGGNMKYPPNKPPRDASRDKRVRTSHLR